MKHSRLARLLISTIGPAFLGLLVLALPTLAAPAAQPIRSTSSGFSPSITTTKTEDVGIMNQPLAPDALPHDLTVSLYASGKIEPGREFSYGLYFTNAGTTAADNVVITNTLPAGVTVLSVDWCTISPTVNGQQLVWQLGNVPPGSTGTLAFSVQLTGTAAIGSHLTDIAQIAGSGGDDNPANNQATNVLTVTAPARDLAVSKSMNGPSFPGANTQYVINYSNQGSLTVTNLIITDVLPVSVTYLSYSGANVNAVLTGTVLVFTRSLLAGDASDNIAINVHIANSALPGRVITNVVRTTTTDSEIDLTNNVYTRATTIAAPTRDLYVSKVATKGSFQAGAQIAYQIYFDNYGNYTATNTILTDTLPAYTTWITWTGYLYNPGYVDLRGAVTPTIVGNRVIWNFGALGPGASGSLYPVIQINGGAPNAAVLTNQVNISTHDPDTDYGDNSSSETGVVTPYGGPDASGYRFKDETMLGGPTFNWLDATTGTRSFVFGDDRSAGPIPIGFSFFYYGRIYTTTYLVTNGYIALGGPENAYYNRNIPNPGVSPYTFIAPFWDDLQVCPNQTNQAIYFKQGGSAPNRYFAAEWAGVSHLSAPTKPMTFETVLYESGEILFQYQSLTGTLDSASVGIESYEGLRGLEYEFNQNNLINSRAILFTPRILKVYLPVIYRQ